MDFEYLEEYKHPTSCILNITDACNLKCTYCFVEQHPHYMSLSTAKKAVDWLVQNLKWKETHNILNPNERCNLCFFGGEPTLLFDEVVIPTLQYIQNNYTNLFHLGITTNGTLLSEDRILQLKEYNINSIMLSMDGDKNIQELNRPARDGTSSFEKIYPNIPYILKYYPHTTFRATCSRETVKNMFETYLFAETEGFKNFFITPDHRSLKWTPEEIIDLKNGCQQIYQYQLNQFICGIRPMDCSFIRDTYVTIISHDINVLHNDILINNTTPFRCGLGTTSCSIGYDGTIYGCQEQPSKDKKNLFDIGSLYNEDNKDNNYIDEQAQINLLNTYFHRDPMQCSNDSLCDTCLLKKEYCKLKDCPSTSYDLFRDFNTLPEVQCIWLQENIKNALINMKILTEVNCKLFEQYLMNKINIFSYPIKNKE